MLSVLLGVVSNPLGGTEAMHAVTSRENMLLAPIDCTTVITSLCDPASFGPGTVGHLLAVLSRLAPEEAEDACMTRNARNREPGLCTCILLYQRCCF